VRRKHGDFECNICWTPGHYGIKGNEAADEAAKEATQGESSRPNRLPRELQKCLPESRSALKCTYMHALQERACRFWAKSPQYAKTSEIDNSLPSNRFLELTKEMTRRQASLILQLHTGHAPLNKHLNCINKAPTALCPACGLADETIFHFLMSCPAYAQYRTELGMKVPRPRNKISDLLTNPAVYKHTLRYIQQTGRIKNVFGNVTGMRNQSSH
jgi:hypothetical protein